MPREAGDLLDVRALSERGQGSSFAAGTPTAVAARATANVSNAYDVAADGRLLVTTPAGGTDADTSLARIVVVQNWFDELKARVPTTPRRD